MTLEGPVDWERLTAVLQHRLVDRYPVFRQVVVEASNPLGMPHWEDDPDFSIDHHLHHATLARAGRRGRAPGLRRAQDAGADRPQPAAVALLRHRRLPRRLGRRLALPPRPRRRHRAGRGAALAHRRASRTTTCSPSRRTTPRTRRRARAAAHQPARGRRPVRPPAHRPGVGRPARCAGRCSASCRPSLRPSYAVEALTTAWQTGQIADKLLLGHNPDSPLSGAARPRPSARSGPRPRPLVDIKLVGRTAGATVNDVLVGAVSAAISRYVSDRGGDPAGPVDDGARSTSAPPGSRSPASWATSSRS